LLAQNASTAAIDAEHTAFAADCEPIEYPPFQPPLSTDLLTSVALTGTNHAEDQPVHLRVVPTRKYVEGLYSQSQNESPSTLLDPAVGAGAKAVESVAEAMAAESGLGDEAAKARVEEEQRTRREHVARNVGMYAGLLGRACPAAVYEYVRDEDADAAVEGKEGASEEGESWRGHRLVINSQNCIHCKLCDVKVPTQDITWTVPEGGGGPKYSACSVFLFLGLSSFFQGACGGRWDPRLDAPFLPALVQLGNGGVSSRVGIARVGGAAYGAMWTEFHFSAPRARVISFSRCAISGTYGWRADVCLFLFIIIAVT
jgi:ferredoxin-like protein FixX